MKYIVKGAPPPELTVWLKGFSAEDRKNTKFKKAPQSVRAAVKKELIKEQGAICCYCEQEIEFDNAHIEHFLPQSNHDVDPFDYQNLHASCLRNPTRGEAKHCGHFKNRRPDTEQLLSPLDSQCEEAFLYDFEGQVSPKDNSSPIVKTTIKRLGLRTSKLKRLRKAAIETVAGDEKLTNDEFKQFVDAYLQKTDDGRFNPFWTTIRYLFAG